LGHHRKAHQRCQRRNRASDQRPKLVGPDKVGAKEEIVGGDDFTQHLLDLQEAERSEPATFESIASTLVREPFRCSLRQIANLNSYQIREIYFRPRDEDDDDAGFGGMEERAVIASMMSREDHLEGFKRTFYELWRQEGLDDAAIEEKWKASDYARSRESSNGSPGREGQRSPTGG
jgi:hypothetical protein